MISGKLRVVAEIPTDGLALSLIGAGQEPVMLCSIILWILIIVVLWSGQVRTVLAEEVGWKDRSGGEAHDKQVEEAHQGHKDGDSWVDGVLGVEEEQSHEDHEEALSVKEAEELEVF